MHLDLDNHSSDLLSGYDVCIIGSGPAGLALASQFVDSDVKVIILESGRVDPDPLFQQLNEGESAGPRKVNLTGSRLRCFGGAGKIWAGVCRPVSEQDLKEREYVAHSGWPIDYSDLEPYYRKAANLLDLDYDLFEGDRWKSDSEMPVIFDGLGDHLLRGNRYQQASLKNRDLTNKYRDTFFHSENITVVTNATVVDLVQNKSTGVDSVLVKSISNRGVMVKAGHFVLCAGAIENVRILLNSSVDDLVKKNRFLGACFMSHPAFTDVGTVIRSREDADCLDTKHLNKRFGFELRYGEQDKLKLLRHSISLSPLSIKRQVSESMKSEKVSYLDLIGNIKLLDVMSEAKCRILGEDPVVENWKISVGIEQEPRLSNKITLSDMTDVHGKNKLRIFWDTVSELEMNTVLEAFKGLSRELVLSGVGVAKISDSLLNKETFKRQDPINHHIGTTRMSSSAEDGVVDRNLKCFGLDNLYVSSSSVFPTSSNVNPTLTIIALSLRLGAYLKKRLNSYV